MGEKQEEKKRRVPRKWIVAGLVVLVLAGGFTAWRLYCSSLVSRQLDAIKAAGHPVTIEKLDARHPIPAENAASAYYRAFARLVEPPDEDWDLLPLVGRAELPPLSATMPEEMRKVVEQCVEANREALELMHSASEIRDCRFVMRPLSATDLTRPSQYQPRLRQGTRLLSYEALVYAEQGDGSRAIGSLRSSLAGGRHLAGKTSMTDFALSIGLDTLTLDALERVMSLIPIPENDALEMQGDLVTAEVPEALARMIDSEVCLGAWYTHQPRIVRARDLGGSPSGWQLQDMSGVSDLDLATYLGFLSDALAVAPRPFPERIRAMRELDLVRRFEAVPKMYRLTRGLMPNLAYITEQDGKHVARLRAARAALAVERYRRTRGPLPETLSDLVPDFLDAVPQDPFDGEPLRYKRLDVGYVVYSVGPNEADDGGRTGLEEADDVPFTVAR